MGLLPEESTPFLCSDSWIRLRSRWWWSAVCAWFALHEGGGAWFDCAGVDWADTWTNFVSKLLGTGIWTGLYWRASHTTLVRWSFMLDWDMKSLRTPPATALSTSKAMPQNTLKEQGRKWFVLITMPRLNIRKFVCVRGWFLSKYFV